MYHSWRCVSDSYTQGTEDNSRIALLNFNSQPLMRVIGKAISHCVFPIIFRIRKTHDMIILVAWLETRLKPEHKSG